MEKWTVKSQLIEADFVFIMVVEKKTNNLYLCAWIKTSKPLFYFYVLVVRSKSIKIKITQI